MPELFAFSNAATKSEGSQAVCVVVLFVNGRNHIHISKGKGWTMRARAALVFNLLVIALRAPFGIAS